MELNREKIIKALECCTNADKVCDDCILLEDRNCGVHLLRFALSLIKELTEENEKLRDRNRACIYLSDNETVEYCVDGPCSVRTTPEKIKFDTIKVIFDRVKLVMFLHLYEHKPFGSGEYVSYFGIDLEQAIEDLREEIEAGVKFDEQQP